MIWILVKKYSPIGELGDFAQEYAESLHEAMNHIACIADRDTVIAISGAPKKEFLNRPLSLAVEKVMESRRSIIINNTAQHEFYRVAEEEAISKFTAEAIAPIIAEGDPFGAVIVGTRNPDVKMGDLEIKLVETAAGFLAKQMEQ